MCFDEDLDDAMKIAVREAVEMLTEQKMIPLTRDEAYSLVALTGDCRVSQVVDIRKGIHCPILKAIFSATKF
jgi:acetamidase/formamidase